MKTTLDESCRNYRLSVQEGSSRLSRRNTVSGQVFKYRAAMRRNRKLCTRVTRLLREHGVASSQYYAYIAYAHRLARLCRKYTSLTLENEALMLRWFWQARGLDPDTLALVTHCVAVSNQRSDTASI